MTFELEPQDYACKTKRFSRRKVELPNGIVLHTCWYTLPPAPRRGVPLPADTILPNGIRLRATTYKNPGWGLTFDPVQQAKDYHAWKEARDKARDKARAEALTPPAKKPKRVRASRTSARIAA
jgi:hypothetical protein